jgi:hypothetical protein
LGACGSGVAAARLVWFGFTDASICREEFKPAALDHDDGDDDEMSGGESDGGADDAGGDQSASASVHNDVDQRSSNDDHSEAAGAREDALKSEPDVPDASQLSLSQMREKIAALEKVRK